MSPSGIVHVFTKTNKNRYLIDKSKKNEESTEYISLSDWMKESTQFNIVSNIHFFKNYVSTKIFKLWRNNVKYRKYCNTRQILVNNLFFCKPAFAKSVMAMNQNLQEVHNEKLVNFSAYGQNAVPLDRFKGDQRNILTKVEKNFISIFEKVISSIEATLKVVKENRYEKFTSDLEKMNFGKQVKQKAIYLQKLEAKEKKLRKALAENDYNQRKQFVRLINYMGLENLVTAMNTYLNTIKTEIISKDRNGLFITTATFNGDHITFTLSDGEII